MLVRVSVTVGDFVSDCDRDIVPICDRVAVELGVAAWLGVGEQRVLRPFTMTPAQDVSRAHAAPELLETTGAYATPCPVTGTSPAEAIVSNH